MFEIYLQVDLAYRYMQAMFLKRQGKHVRLARGGGLLIGSLLIACAMYAQPVKADSIYLPLVTNHNRPHVATDFTGCVVGGLCDTGGQGDTVMQADGSAIITTIDGYAFPACLRPSLGCQRDAGTDLEYYEDDSFVGTVGI